MVDFTLRPGLLCKTRALSLSRHAVLEEVPGRLTDSEDITHSRLGFRGGEGLSPRQSCSRPDYRVKLTDGVVTWMNSTDSESTEAVIHRFFERFAANDRDGFAETLADDFVFTALGHTHDAASFIDVEFAYYDAFPDFAYTLDGLRTSGPLAGFRWTITGTHTGTRGPGPLADIEPTGNSIEVTGLNVATVENGEISELWGEYDGLGLFEQLGIVTVEPIHAAE